MQRLFALDLKDDPALIAEYESHHRRIWPEVAELIRAQGVVQMEIFRLGTRLVMRMETAEDFDPGRFAEVMAGNERNQAWERLMDRFQQATPWSAPGAKWTAMKQIFDLQAQP